MDKNYIEATPLDIWVMNTDGSKKRRLTNNGATNWAPSWHPDGKRIIFSSNMDDWHEKYKGYGHNFEIYMVHTESGSLERITFNTVFDSFPMFSSDGKKLAFGSNRNATNPRATDIFIADWNESDSR
jgi:Tol biopolymer transport system component